jgi:hypothetical protein
MALVANNLYTDIKNAAEAAIEAHKTKTVIQKTFVENNGIISFGNDISTKSIPDGDDSIKAIIDIIAKAVADKVVEHIQNHLTITNGTVTASSLTYSNTLNGAGGGVPGPVTIPGAALTIPSGTINVSEKGFK